MKQENLGLRIFNGIFKKFYGENLIPKDEYSIRSFIMLIFKFFYLNLKSQDYDQELLDKAYLNLCNVLHKMVNLNPSKNIPILVEQSKPTVRSSKFVMLSTPSSFKSSFLFNPSIQPLKLLCFLIIDFLDYFQASEVQEIKVTYFKFIGMFFQKMLFYLETQRHKLKEDKCNLIEICLYQILLKIFREIKNHDYVSLIKESLLTYKDIPNYSKKHKLNFSSRMLELFDILENKEISDQEFFEAIHEKILLGGKFIKELED